MRVRKSTTVAGAQRQVHDILLKDVKAMKALQTVRRDIGPAN